jgi:UPF0755 protein
MRALFACVLLGAGFVVAGCMGSQEAPAPVETTPQLQTLRIIFRRGSRDATWRTGRGGPSDRHRQARVTPRLTKTGYLQASGAAVPPTEFRRDWKLSSIEGFLFPATYEFTKLTSSSKLVSEQLRAFRRNWRKVNLQYAKSKNLTPYDVLIIASMIEKEAVAPAERKLVAAVIYNRLHNRMPLGIDATIRYGRNVPGPSR